MVHTKLQLRMKGILPPNLRTDPSIYHRFLKARDYDLEKAEIMLVKHINWRKAHQIDTLLDNFQPKEFFRKYVEPTFIGFGKEEEMVIYCPVGKIEVSDTLKCSTMNEYMKCWTWYIESNLKLLKENSEKTGKISTQMSFIFDLDQLTLENASNKSSIDLFMRLINLFQDNYPETLKAVYIINAPCYYVLVYSVVKTAMSRAMVKKIHVFGHNCYQEKLLDIIHADLLPAFLGGNRTDPDGSPFCHSFISQAGRIPPIYHISREDRDFKDISQVKKLVIPKYAKEEICIDVPVKGSSIHWEFLVKSKDIDFGLFRQISDQTIEDILPMENYYTPDGKEMGSYKCQYPGKYFLAFENSQSWLTSRVVEYCVSVQTPPPHS